MNAKPTDIDSYLANVPAEARATLQELRRTIRSIAPGAVESISYGMPTFKYLARPLTYFGAWKDHCALYGLNAAGHQDQLSGYDTDKGTIRFASGSPLPDALVRMLIIERIEAIEADHAGAKGT